MPIQHQQDLFFLQLAEIYDIEQKLSQFLPELAKETQNSQAKPADS